MRFSWLESPRIEIEPRLYYFLSGYIVPLSLVAIKTTTN